MRHIAVIGAGSVGSAAAYTLAASGLSEKISIIDIDQRRAMGEAMDISHGAGMYPPCEISGGGYELLDGADITIMTAGANQEKNETRHDLLGRNLKVMEAVSKEISRRAPDTVLIVVTNPVDALTRAAIDMTGLPPRRVIGSGTVLDTMRMRGMLASHTGIDPRNIHGFVLGEHGDSELPAWSTVSISGMTMDEYCRDCGQCTWQLPERMRAAFDSEVRRAAYRVIDLKGITNYAIALAVRRIVQAISRDEKSILTVSSLMNGFLNIHDVCLSLPCVIGKGGVERVIPIKLAPEEQILMKKSAEAVRIGVMA